MELSCRALTHMLEPVRSGACDALLCFQWPHNEPVFVSFDRVENERVGRMVRENDVFDASSALHAREDFLAGADLRLQPSAAAVSPARSDDTG